MSSTTFGGAVKQPHVERYSAAMQAFHWIVALLMFAVLPLAWAMVEMPRTDPSREWLYMLHKSVGVTILVLVAVRLILRVSQPIPPEPAGTPRWMRATGVASHWLLYVILFVMPISGYVLSSAGGNAVSYFGLFDLPMLPKDDALRHTAVTVHLTVQWAVYALIALHLLATAWHVAVRRDGLLERELPPQRIV
jgi:cytochrome b561